MQSTQDYDALNMKAPDRASCVQLIKRSGAASVQGELQIGAPYAKSQLVCDGYKTSADSLGTLITIAGFGVLLVTAKGEIIYANGVAEKLIRLRRGLYSQRGRVVAAGERTNRKLQNLISAASFALGESIAGSIIVSDQNGEGLIAVHVASVSRKASNELDSRERHIAGLFVTVQNQDVAGRANAFGPLFGLSPAETRMLATLISAKSLTSAARRLNVTELTARTHLKHIMAKTNTHSQAKLTRLFFEMTIPCEKWMSHANFTSILRPENTTFMLTL
jgi:DNA-binding CsgD family transcriptional regulator